MDNNTWKILLVEDDEDDYLLTKALLSDVRGEKTFDLEWVTHIDSALSALDAKPRDVVLVDYALGSQNGVELVREAVARGCQAPIILLSGFGTYEVDLEAMQAGAVDYLTKGEITAPLLERTIRYAIERKRTEEQLRRSQDVLEERVRERTQELARVNEQLHAAIAGLRDEISERLRVEEALRESEQRFRTIFEEAAIGIVLNDLSGRILATNPALQEMLGYSGEELHQYTTADITHPFDQPVIMDKLEKLIRGQQNRFRTENRFLHKYGYPVWARQSVSIVRDKAGLPQMLISMVENITERKQMELELAEVHRKLIDSREAERLYLAQELHDGPMQDLYGISYQLQGLHGLEGNGDTASRISALQSDINQVNQVLRVIAGELRPPTLTPFGLQKTILSHAENFQMEHPELEIHLDLKPDGQTLPEPLRLALYRIYQQTLANILRHAQAQNIWVRFDFDETHVMLEIRDDGRGFVVPPRWIDFVREGHLGLAGAAERAEAVGGTLEVESAPGQGTILRVKVPRAVMQFP